MLGGPPPREQLKRELKAWEKSFFASEGRAPEPKDLQAHPEVKAKYRLYERLKRDSHVGESSSKELGAKESRVGLPPPPPAVEEPKSDEVIAATPTAPRTSTFILGTPVPVNHENLIHDDGGAGTPTLSPIQPNRPHQPSNSIHPQPPVNPQARNSVFGSHLNKSSTSGDTWTRKGKAWDIDITEQLIQPSDKKSGFVNGTTSKDRIRDSKRNPLSERPSESSFEEPNPFAERRNPFSERTRKPLAELGMHSTAADDAEMHGMEVDDENMDSGHAIRLPEMSLHPLHEALDYPTDDNDFSHDSTSEFELERGLSVFDESTWHTSDDLAEIPIAGHNAYVKKKKYSARLREEEEVFGREVEWPAQGEETDASVDFEVFAPRLGSPDAEESEGSDKENSPDDGKVKRRLQRMQTEERAVAAGARGVKRRTLEDRDGGAESMQVSEKEGSSDEDVDADGDADSESEDSDSGKRGKKKASAGKAGKPKPAKKARTRGNKPASDDTKKRRSTTSSAPKGSVSNNFVSMKINKPRLGKYGKAMASRRGQGKFAKAISSVGSSYSTNFETNRSRTANRAVEDGFGGYGVLIEEADFAFDRPVGSAAVSVEPRVLGESRFLVDEDAPNAVAVSDVFFDAAADASPKEAFVDLDRALQECGVGPGFRDGQREALLHVLSGRSTLAVMPTGSGKSLLYQLPSYVLSRLQPSLTLVVTPTISLMEDQLRQLPTGLRGGVISSARDDVQATVDDLCAGLIDVLFVTPERLQSQAFLDLLGSGTCPPVKLACVDEAHCVSEWSHNFRPAFLHLDRALREVLKVPVILALTGTATAQARKDIAKLLQLEALVDTSTVRSNLRLTASKEEERDVAIFNLLRTAPWRDMNAVIVYCMRRDQCDSLASYLRARNFQADSYHAGRTPDERRIIQSRFFTGTIKVLVATVAYGMGINKSDIRGIIHHSLPKSLENYVQEIGRAGRDGEDAHCHLFLNGDDYVRLRSFAFADAPYKAAIEELVHSVFAGRAHGGKKRKYPGDEASGSLVAIPLQRIEEMDLKKEVAATLLTYIELRRADLLRVMPIGHSACSIRFIKTAKEDLADTDPFVAAILRHLEEEEGSKLPTFDVLQVCQDLEMDISELKAKLRSLKGKKEITFDFVKDAYVVRIERPCDAQERQEIVAELCAEVNRLEKIRVQKVDDTYAAFLPVAFSTFSEALPKHPESDDEQEGKIDNADAPLKRSIASYFSSELAADQDPGQPRKVSRWGFVDPILVEKQKKEYADMHTNIRVFVWKRQGDFASGRIIARILHGLDSPKYPASEWNQTNLWGKGKHFNFRELERMADESLQLYRASKDRSKSSPGHESS